MIALWRFRRKTLFGRLVILLQVAPSAGWAVDGPILNVFVNGSTPYVFRIGTPPVTLQLPETQPIRIHWTASLEDDGEPVEVRFGWDISNPDRDAEWEQGWCSTCRQLPALRSFAVGTHSFLLQGRDHAGLTTRAEIELEVIQLGAATTSWSAIKAFYGR